MAIFVAGKSECALCEQVIERREDAVATPAFLRDTHPLYQYSDAVFHRACFAQSPDRGEVERLRQRYEEVMRTAPTDLGEYERWLGGAMKEFE
jgi:hypothetical protein